MKLVCAKFIQSLVCPTKNNDNNIKEFNGLNNVVQAVAYAEKNSRGSRSLRPPRGSGGGSPGLRRIFENLQKMR